jgi:succinate dehydrogenase/fumarate reductase flavoprotein subunit
MRVEKIKINGITFPLYSLNTLVIGSGAAALNAAVCLHDYGQRDMAIATDNWGGGTSNNAGSDKQTYYKLSLAGDLPDSPLQMAQDLFKGGSMHGDIALCEAQNSLQAFFHLLSLGVPFPHDKYGGYVGYKTDHDPRQRATSVGPLTSHLMFECLAKDVKKKKIKIYNNHEIIALITQEDGKNKKVIGAIAFDHDNIESSHLGVVVFNAVNIIMGTGGPAGIYKTSAYPVSQIGSHGLAFEIGATGQNLTESQYGLASLKFRWNLSGTYQQVIPRYISTDRDGKDEREFLNDCFPDMGKLATAIFLKGYQWPFDPRKVQNYGSSLIDILVYKETVVKGRRVFLDFTRNPGGARKLQDFSFNLISKEAYSYLEKSGAFLPTPFERLKKMNQPAVDIYKKHGIDLAKDYLEIAVCAQHNNGGLKGNIWWESNIRHLFPVGEVNGTHGVYRPGGSALNSGQVGSMRAALFISKRYSQEPPDVKEFIKAARLQIRAKCDFAKSLINFREREEDSLQTARAEIQQRMSACGAHIRNAEQVRKAANDAWKLYSKLKTGMRVASPKDLPSAFKNLDLCLTHALYLETILEYLEKGGKSRGSFLVLDPNGEKPCPCLGDEWKFSLNPGNSFVDQKILEISLDEKMCVKKQWVEIRPIPQEDSWFENIWNDFRRGHILDEEAES